MLSNLDAEKNGRQCLAGVQVGVRGHKKKFKRPKARPRPGLFAHKNAPMTPIYYNRTNKNKSL